MEIKYAHLKILVNLRLIILYAHLLNDYAQIQAYNVLSIQGLID